MYSLLPRVPHLNPPKYIYILSAEMKMRSSFVDTTLRGEEKQHVFWHTWKERKQIDIRIYKANSVADALLQALFCVLKIFFHNNKKPWSNCICPLSSPKLYIITRKKSLVCLFENNKKQHQQQTTRFGFKHACSFVFGCFRQSSPDELYFPLCSPHKHDITFHEHQ